MPCFTKTQPNPPKTTKLNLDSPSQSFEYAVCSQKSTSARGLHTHYGQMHKSGGIVEKEPVVISEPKSDPRCNVPDDPMSESFSCCPCKKVFHWRQALLMHQLRKHDIRNMKDIGSLEKPKQASAKEGVDSAVNTRPEISTRTFFCCVCLQQFSVSECVGSLWHIST